MREKISSVNHNILKWAREQLHYSLEDIAKSLNKKVEDIENWENGTDAPTYIQLETLAGKYERSIAIFFFQEPPQEEDLKDRIMLRSSEIKKLKPRIYSLYRQASNKQLALEELHDSENDKENKIFVDISADKNQSIPRLAEKVRKYLGITIDVQKSWKDHKTALANWRDEIQNKGVFVFKEAFHYDEIDGFCLTHPSFPVIYLNNTSHVKRQIFTLFHELAHVLLKSNGIVSEMRSKNENTEQFCNKFSSEFLVPLEDIKDDLMSTKYSDSKAEEFANRYNVSSQVILYKYRECDAISNELFQKKISEWVGRGNKPVRKNKQSGSGGNYYNTQGIYLGRHFLELAFKQFYRGRCSLDELAIYLNVKEKSIPMLEDYLIRSMVNK